MTVKAFNYQSPPPPPRQSLSDYPRTSMFKSIHPLVQKKKEIATGVCFSFTKVKTGSPSVPSSNQRKLTNAIVQHASNKHQFPCLSAHLGLEWFGDQGYSTAGTYLLLRYVTVFNSKNHLGCWLLQGCLPGLVQLEACTAPRPLQVSAGPGQAGWGVRCTLLSLQVTA